MTQSPTHNTLFETLHCCVIIPTYNNEKTLQRVVDGVLAQTQHVIIVNDGATDGTTTLLGTYQEVEIITFPQNKGKGMALRAGFKKAIALGYQYAITIDSDGQHFPSDLPLFLKELKQQDPKQPLVLIGSRKMDDPSVPGKSSFGNKFSNFWYYIETGIKLTDTQSGFRLYPLDVIKKMSLFTRKFELEIEVIVKLAWRNVTVRNIPIQVLYDPDERVSHFRPFQDFTRISILNTWLVILTLLWYLPKRLLFTLKKKGFKTVWREEILKSDDPPLKKSAAIMLGVFIGIAPLWGLQTVLVLSLATLFKLNKAVAFLCSNISIPPVIPFIVYISYQLGALIMGREMDMALDIEAIRSGGDMFKGVTQYLIGSLFLALLVTLVLGVSSYLYFSFRNTQKQDQ